MHCAQWYATDANRVDWGRKLFEMVCFLAVVIVRKQNFLFTPKVGRFQWGFDGLRSKFGANDENSNICRQGFYSFVSLFGGDHDKIIAMEP